MSQRWLKQEMESLRQQWRGDKIYEINGKRKTLNFKQWLDHTRKHEQFINLENNNKEYKRLLNEREDCFFFDTQKSAAIDEAIRNASQAYRPILAMEWPASDASVEITTQRLDQQPSDRDSFISTSEDEPDEEIQLGTPLDTAMTAPAWALLSSDGITLPSSPPRSATPSP
ncbi:hypothetical protein HIM_10150 [Hirsutella minnesotensis 3608]|uniref:Uncharacterized protein n=1 Tax=Hirsutella minnesotensis 3608 TaxID=1043627 RepID=A0A0F7ZRZ0_9HYPO|nr:hypothetical protein HIM_10150 [Hirsutella minnesotensis 3608]